MTDMGDDTQNACPQLLRGLVTKPGISKQTNKNLEFLFPWADLLVSKSVS
jgi:hypothetical protein